MIHIIAMGVLLAGTLLGADKASIQGFVAYETGNPIEGATVEIRTACSTGEDPLFVPITIGILGLRMPDFSVLLDLKMTHTDHHGYYQFSVKGDTRYYVRAYYRHGKERAVYSAFVTTIVPRTGTVKLDLRLERMRLIKWCKSVWPHLIYQYHPMGIL
jgi:hypothetical protein